MRCAILCPGRSLHKTWPDIGKHREYEEVIAVSSAIDADAAITVWSQVEPMRRWLLRMHAPKLEECRPRMWSHVKSKGVVRRKVTKMMKLMGMRPMKLRGSFFHAVVGACYEGATSLDIYGHDMEGDGNYDPATGNRIGNARGKDWWDEHWSQERGPWERLKAQLQGKGIEVNEIRNTASR